MLRATGALTLANIRSFYRDRAALFWTFAFPILFVILFGSIFSGSGPANFDVGWVDQDGTPPATELRAGFALVPLLTLSDVGEEAALQQMRDGHLDAVIVVPKGTGDAVAAAATGGSASQVALRLFTDPSQQTSSQTVQQIVGQVVGTINQRLSGRPAALSVEVSALQTQAISPAAYFVPSILAMALMQLGVFAAIPLAAQREKLILKRLGATPLRRWALVGSNIVMRLLIAAVQAAIIIGIGMVLFDVQVIGSLLLVAGLVALGALTFTAIGYVIASYARTEESANALTSVVQFPLMFLSGSSFPSTSCPSSCGPSRRSCRSPTSETRCGRLWWAARRMWRSASTWRSSPCGWSSASRSRLGSSGGSEANQVTFDPIGRRRLLAGAFALTLSVAVVPSGAAAGGAVDKLPDLRMASLRQFHLQTTSSGRRLIRFDTTIVNVGKGPFEVTGSRGCSSLSACPKMAVKQVIYRTDGSRRYVVRNGWMKWAGDGHNHWHVQRIEKYEIFRRVPGSTGVRRGAKVGFCFFDNVAYRLSLPGAPNNRVYAESGCGVSSSITSRVGLSVGWGDLYPWDFVYQWIDITGLPAGPYRVCVTTDQQDRYLETSDTNNMVWQDVTIYSSGGLGIGAKGWTSCGTGIGSAAQARAEADGEDYPDATPISGDEPGSVSCPIPTESEAARDQGRAALACDPARAPARPATTVSAAAPVQRSLFRAALPAALAPTRRAYLAARATDVTCQI